MTPGATESSLATYRAPYGQSCSNCAQMKCKCIYPKDGGQCQRCQRLGKECRQIRPPKRRLTRKSPAAADVRLEEKLEKLATLLQAGVQFPGTNLAPEQQGQPLQLLTRSTVSPAGSLDATLGISRDTNEIRPLETSTADGSGQESVSLSQAEPTALQAEEYLTLFQTQFLPYFPCVHIPPDTTAEQLRQERPFTWLCIMAATCKLAAQRRALYDNIKTIVAQRMIHTSANTDIDILLGLLIYLGWSNQQVYNKANVPVFTQLAHAAVYGLGIQNPSARSKIIALYVHTNEEESSLPSSTTMEVRRAVLACFLITSIISTSMQITDALRWTPFMDECLETLEEQQECLNDEILAQQVRLQLVTQELNSGPLAATLNSTHALPAFYLRSMHAQLQSGQPRLAPDSQSYRILLLHHHYTALILNEATTLTKNPLDSRSLNFQQLEHLHACLEATKAWFDLFLTIPPAEYIGFPFSIFAQLEHNLLILYQMSTLEDPSWDTSTVRQKIDVLSTLDTVIQNMSQAAALAALDDEPNSDIISQLAKMYRPVRISWATNLGADASALPDRGAGEPSAETLQTMPIDLPLTPDHGWLTGVLTSIVNNP
ncbi:Zn(II)2Cys6 transcription factor domain-containing protein [Aspergillus lucknowensis]|uniref:Zn(2)-C6 fungal-type domain-containing protein n=1 Tax=Aspergillus lucknowensis TaxID=176173 RepID=A0ABR4LI88_9EURO